LKTAKHRNPNGNMPPLRCITLAAFINKNAAYKRVG